MAWPSLQSPDRDPGKAAGLGSLCEGLSVEPTWLLPDSATQTQMPPSGLGNVPLRGTQTHSPSPSLCLQCTVN